MYTHTEIGILLMLIAIYVDGMKGQHYQGEGEGSGKGGVNTGVVAKPGIIILFNNAWLTSGETDAPDFTNNAKMHCGSLK